MSRRWLRRMRSPPWSLRLVSAACLALGGAASLAAQGTTSAEIRGTVRAPDGGLVDGAVVRAANRATGFASETRVRNGRFFLPGLAVGGPYSIVVRSLGYSPEILNGLTLSLGDQREVSFTLVSLPRLLDTVRTTANDDRSAFPTAGGVGSAVSDSMLRRLPTLNRDVYDFVRLTPQVTSRFGLSGGGAGIRTNAFVVDGVSDRQLQGNNVMGGLNGGKSISIEAVQEYQVLLAPYDARYGDFTGLLVNAVTKSGTNEFHGSAYGFLRNAALARDSSFVGSSPYQREQYGFSLGGPIVRDRLLFFVAPEFQYAATPAPGPYLGQGASAAAPVPVSAADVARFASILRTKSIDPGTGGQVTLLNPNVALFGRVDVALPEMGSRLVLRGNYSRVDAPQFARSLTTTTFPLSSSAFTIRTLKRTAAAQLFTQLPGGVFNELQLAYTNSPFIERNYSASPLIQVQVSSGTATMTAGAPLNGQGTGSRQLSFEVGDHVMFHPGRAHTVGVGAHVEVFQYGTSGLRGGFGQWRFASLDSLANDSASFFSITKDVGGLTAVRGAEPSAYLNDTWRVDDRLSLTFGLRADALALSSRPAYNAAVDSVLQRRTSDFPARRVQWSPRFGFTWTLPDERTSVRGGTGIFVGRPPLGWLIGPMRWNGASVRTLTCNSALGPGRVPPFAPYPAVQPTACSDGKEFSGGPVYLVDRNLRMAESWRTSLAVARRLRWNTDASVEALYSKVRSDFVFSNADLRGPQSLDAHGRVFYGTIDARGVAHPSYIDGARFGNGEVIDLRNQSRGYSWSVTGQLDKPFSDRAELHASYTYSRVRDVQSLTNASAVAPLDIWASGRMLSGRQDDLATGISAFDVPHRVVLSATYAMPWKRGGTNISLYYIGESGAPVTYGDSSGLGDLNADGTSANDPIYVPRDANDPSEMVFSGRDSAAQGSAFERFIRDTPCLRRQRGHIMARNSCRGAWVNTSHLAIRQSLPAFRAHTVSLQVEVFDVLNLLNSSWGLLQLPNAAIVRQIGETADLRPTYRFDAANVRSSRNLESGYQLQLSLRYGF